MTVRELIKYLMDCCDLDAYVRVVTSNRDVDGRTHQFEFTGVDKNICMDSLTGNQYISLMFNDWHFNPKPWIKIKGGFKCDCGYEVMADDVDDMKFCPCCGQFKGESE